MPLANSLLNDGTTLHFRHFLKSKRRWILRFWWFRALTTIDLRTIFLIDTKMHAYLRTQDETLHVISNPSHLGTVNSILGLIIFYASIIGLRID